MLATDNPVADILLGSDNDVNKLYAEAWGKVLSIDTLDEAVKAVYSHSIGFSLARCLIRHHMHSCCFWRVTQFFILCSVVLGFFQLFSIVKYYFVSINVM